MSPNYDKVASVYDALARVVFGSSQEKAKKQHLSKIKGGDKILIIGGGTGSILEYIPNYELEVDYVDSSNNMIERAKKRERKKISVHFHCIDIFQFRESDYDVVICNFFLDQFNTEKANALVGIIHQKLNPSGLVLFSDFVNSKRLRHRILIKSMYLFFESTAKLGKVILSDYKILFLRQGFILLSNTFVTGNIRSDLYIKA
jgi:2-polyprenyl-3-methyl-5-hydroxy-6-metoxy-1,4-benzoquinol methylase